MENKEKIYNALNESSLAMQFTMFHIAHSPLFPILEVMAKYDSFGNYIAECAESISQEFFPNLSVEDNIKQQVNS